MVTLKINENVKLNQKMYKRKKSSLFLFKVVMSEPLSYHTVEKKW